MVELSIAINGRTYIEGEFVNTGMLIEDEIIKSIEKGVNGDININLEKYEIIIPQIADIHVHLRNLNQILTEAEHLKYTGVGCAWGMGNTSPRLDCEKNVKAYYKKIKRVEKLIGIELKLWPLLTPQSTERELKKIGAYSNNRFKAFYGKSTGTGAIFFEDKELFIEKAMLLPTNAVLCGHHEYQLDLDECASEWDYMNPITHIKARPVKAEVNAVKNSAKILEKREDLTVIYTHMSSDLGAREVKKIKKKFPDRAKADLTYHHATFDSSHYARKGSDLKCNPPVREIIHTMLLKQYLCNNLFDYLVSDHAPHTLNAKRSKNPPSGCGSYNVGALGRLIKTYHNNKKALRNIVNAASLNIKPEWAIKAGNPAKLLRVDLRPALVKVEYLKSFGRHANVYLGEEMPYLKGVVNGNKYEAINDQ